MRDFAYNGDRYFIARYRNENMGLHEIDGVLQRGYRHPNGGGFVTEDSWVDLDCYVGPNAIVGDHSHVRNGSRIMGDTKIIHADVTGSNLYDCYVIDANVTNMTAHDRNIYSRGTNAYGQPLVNWTPYGQPRQRYTTV